MFALSPLYPLSDIGRCIHLFIQLAIYKSAPYRVFSKISRPISMRRISLVPAPIS